MSGQQTEHTERGYPVVNTPIDVQTVTQTDVNEILNALETFIKQRPGIDPANYGCDYQQLRYSTREQQRAAIASYRQEVRDIGKDRKRAMAVLTEVRAMHKHSPDLLIDAFRAFSGRLSWVVEPTQVRRARADGNRGGKDSSNPRYPIVTEELRGRLKYTAGQYFPTEYRKAAASVLETYRSAVNQRWSDANPQTFTYRSIEDVKRANKQVGGHWFDRDTLRFFNTVIESRLIGGRYFVTSERMDLDRVKRYSVRQAMPDGSIDTIGEFQQYGDLENARMAARLESGK